MSQLEQSSAGYRLLMNKDLKDFKEESVGHIKQEFETNSNNMEIDSMADNGHNTVEVQEANEEKSSGMYDHMPDVRHWN